MLWRRWSFLRFILASSLAKTSGLKDCLNLSMCQRTRARWTRSLPLARPYGPSPFSRIPFAASQAAQVCAMAVIAASAIKIDMVRNPAFDQIFSTTSRLRSDSWRAFLS